MHRDTESVLRIGRHEGPNEFLGRASKPLAHRRRPVAAEPEYVFVAGDLPRQPENEAEVAPLDRSVFGQPWTAGVWTGPVYPLTTGGLIRVLMARGEASAALGNDFRCRGAYQLQGPPGCRRPSRKIRSADLRHAPRGPQPESVPKLTTQGEGARYGTTRPPDSVVEDTGPRFPSPRAKAATTPTHFDRARRHPLRSRILTPEGARSRPSRLGSWETRMAPHLQQVFEQSTGRTCDGGLARRPRNQAPPRLETTGARNYAQNLFLLPDSLASKSLRRHPTGAYLNRFPKLSLATQNVTPITGNRSAKRVGCPRGSGGFCGLKQEPRWRPL